MQQTIQRNRLLDKLGILVYRIQQHSRLGSAICLGLLLLFVLRYLVACLSRLWFYSSDEYVIAAETIRFVNLDFRQNYYDMPGTPLMLLSALLWALFYPVEMWMHPDSSSPDLTTFTYLHLDWLFTLLRSTTIFFYALSIVLLFLLAKRLLNHAGAFTACLVMAMSGTYADNSAFCRVESMAICLSLGAVLLAVATLDKRRRRTDEWPSWRDPWIWVGLMSGAAAATRLHSVTACLPLLCLILALRKPAKPESQYPTWVLRTGPYLLGAVMAGGVLAWRWSKGWMSVQVPHAAALVAKAGIGMAVLAMAALVLYRIPRTRPLLVRLAGPEVIKILAGTAGGFLIANFTILTRYGRFLNSVEMYSASYIDWERTKWPLWTNIRWYVKFYLSVFAPDTALLILLAVGSLWIVFKRDRRLAPYLLTFLLFFVSKPLNLRSVTHHILLWLPYFAIICAVPVAELYSVLARRGAIRPAWRLAAVATAVAVLGLIATHLTNGPDHALAAERDTQQRLQNIASATDWINARTPLGSTVAMSYFCYNPDIFYLWEQAMDVQVPANLVGGRNFIRWWGQRGELLGLKGYACSVGGGSPFDDTNKLAIEDPNALVDPYRDASFHRVASFGNNRNQIDLFQFDLSK